MSNSMILVTGGAGFIGSQIVKGLNEQGRDNVIIVDDLTDGHKFINLQTLKYADYFDKDEFLELIQTNNLPYTIEAIFHEGACSATTEWNGKYMMEVNFTYSKHMYKLAQDQNCPLIYASSAATYGNSTEFTEVPANEKPINVYGYSKLLFDQYVRRQAAQFDTSHLPPQVVGLRYFNVYGPGETHKGSMASVAYHFNNQIKENDECRLFEGTDGYENGEQLRDFVYVGDIVKLNLWLLDHPEVSGIFNAGTGKCQSFNDVADAVIAFHGKGKKQYIPFPAHLKNAYQSFTEADLISLREAGYEEEFVDVATGVRLYLETL